MKAFLEERIAELNRQAREAGKEYAECQDNSRINDLWVGIAVLRGQRNEAKYLLSVFNHKEKMK